MYDYNHIKATDIPAQTNFYNEVKKNEKDRFTITNEFSTNDKNEDLNTTAKLRLLAFEQVGPFFCDAICKPLDYAVNGIQ